MPKMQAGRTHPDACSPPCPHTPSGMGEKRGGKGVGKLTGQNQDKENTHQMLEKQTCLGDALAKLPPPRRYQHLVSYTLYTIKCLSIVSL